MLNHSTKLGKTVTGILLCLAGLAHNPELKAEDRLPAGMHSLHIEAVGKSWTYCVNVPPQAAQGQPLPLVLILHGAGGSGKGYLERNGWKELSDQAGFVALAPDALPARADQPVSFKTNPRYWNTGQLRILNPRSRDDDVGFIRELLDRVAEQVPVDVRRVYAAGHSSGGGMTFRLGAELPERFAAIAPVAAPCWVKLPQPVSPPPTLFIIGTQDPLVPLGGGERTLPWGKSVTPPIDPTLAAWAKALGCTAEPRSSEGNGLKVVDYGAGKGQAVFRAVFIEGHGHAWPMGKDSGLPDGIMGPNVKTYNATAEIWAFFLQHARQ